MQLFTPKVHSRFYLLCISSPDSIELFQQHKIFQKCGTIFDSRSCSTMNQVHNEHRAFNLRLRSVRGNTEFATLVTPKLLDTASSQSGHHDPWDRTVPVDDVNWDDATVLPRQTARPKKWWVFSFNDYLRSIDRLDVPVEQVQPGTWHIPTPVE
jgi:hypothetical protein